MRLIESFSVSIMHLSNYHPSTPRLASLDVFEATPGQLSRFARFRGSATSSLYSQSMLLLSLPSPHVEILPAPLKIPTILLGSVLCCLRLIWEGVLSSSRQCGSCCHAFLAPGSDAARDGQ